MIRVNEQPQMTIEQEYLSRIKYLLDIAKSSISTAGEVADFTKNLNRLKISLDKKDEIIVLFIEIRDSRMKSRLLESISDRNSSAFQAEEGLLKRFVLLKYKQILEILNLENTDLV